MKPNGDATNEMEQEPGRLFVELGMLIVDGRLPDLSAKGRIEGPHCGSSSYRSSHVCRSSSDQCLDAARYQGEMSKLWRNSIPMCIEVLMCQDCELNNIKHDNHDGRGVLLERWTISALSCRAADMHVSAQSLLQAVRSYLYFSQLSAWLNSSQGSEPKKIVYRVSAPGESYSTTFPQEPDEHLFPVARACKSTGIQVMVTALPRCGQTPQFVSQSVSPPKMKYFRLSEDGESPASFIQESNSDGTVSNQFEKAPQARTREEAGSSLCDSTGSRNNSNSGGSKTAAQSQCAALETLDWSSMQNGGAIPKRNVFKRDLNLPVQNKSGYQTLESPKVLFTHTSLSESWRKYDDCFSVTEQLDDIESELAALRLTREDGEAGKQCKVTGKTDLSLKELKMLPEESRVKFSIGHSPITLSPHSKVFDVRNVFKDVEPSDMKAIRHLSFGDDSRDTNASNGTSSANKDTTNDLATSTPNESQNGVCHKKFETPSTTSLFDKKLQKLSKNLQDHFFRSEEGEKLIENGATNESSGPKSPGFNKSTSLLNSLMKKGSTELSNGVSSKPIPTADDKASFRRSLDSSTSLLFHSQTGLPTQSSPAPIKKRSANGQFGYDCSLNNIKAIKKVISCTKLELDDKENSNDPKYMSRSAPASTNCLLGNFEESLLNGRLEPAGVVDGFSAEIGASGMFCPRHTKLPVTAYFFSLSDDNAPSPYLGHINLGSVGRRGYHVPKKGTVQVTLFNPENSVVKMFVIMYDFSDMPPNSQTFLRQRTFYMPVVKSPRDNNNLPSYLRYLIHLRYSSSKTGRIYLHTDIRLIFARDKFEFDSRIATYELRSFTEGPENPKYSPKR